MRFVHALGLLLMVPVSAQQKAGKPPVAKAVGEQDKKTPDQKPKHVNHLVNETSPYLLSHKNNPVNWYPWGKEALDRAKKENKPIFLSIGYSACHWCHVMERESFENEEIAAEMNKYFICIKVDREERPDLDAIYMAAVTRISGSGGWPMSVWLTPERKPFWGGTYFPPRDDPRLQRPGFLRICKTLGEAWNKKEDLIRKDADNMATYLSQSLSPPVQRGALSMNFFKVAASQSLSRWDKEYGGFGQAPHYRPKFPHASEITSLLISSARHADAVALKCAEMTLEKMSRGGMYDQVAGGFHRYSVDRFWLVPHFEKMLYDNALLAQTYIDAYLLTGKAMYKRIATETLDYMVREMQDEAGGFYSTTDADSEGVEGKYFVWTKAEIDALLAADAPLFSAVYGVTAHGNWHEMKEVTVLSKVLTEAEAAKKFKTTEKNVLERLTAARKVLYDVRQRRVPPLKDDKVLAAWNGMAITAMARGYTALGDERYRAAAQRAAGFVLDNMRQKNGRLFRSWRKGEAKLEAYLSDYGYLADGLVHLFEADFDPRWLSGAKDFLAIVEKHFLDKLDGNFYFTADIHEELVARSKNVQESSIPSGASMVIRAFVRAGLLLADQKLVGMGRNALEANHAVLDKYPAYAVTMLQACDLLLNDPREVVIAGELEDPGTQAFLQRLRKRWPVAHVTTVLHSGNKDALQELVESHGGKTARDGKPAAFVCRFGVCEAPVTDAAAMKLK
jgi:uncharacterized protein